MQIGHLALVVLSSTLLAACGGGNEESSADSADTLEDAVVVRGELFYPERIALPPDTTLMLEIRDQAVPGQPLLASLERALEGQQVPVPFEWAVPAELISEAQAPVFRAAAIARPDLLRLSDAVALAVEESEQHELGSLRLWMAMDASFGQAFDCQGERIVFGLLGETARLVTAGQSHELQAVPAASGARYRGIEDDTVEFWSKGNTAMLTLADHAAERETDPSSRDCTPLNAPERPFSARGQEPPWLLRVTDDETVLTTDYGQTEQRFSAAEQRLSARGIVWDASGQAGQLRINADWAICRDSMTGMPYPYTVNYRLGGQLHRGCGGQPLSLLTASDWQVVAIDGVEPVADSRLDLVFLADEQRVAGGASCNRFNGGFELTGEGLSFGPLATTLMACPGEGLAEQERRYLDALERITRFDIDDQGHLILLAADQPLIRAQPATILDTP